jgi:hypothetical protein
MAMHVVIRDDAPYGIDESTGIGQRKSPAKRLKTRTAATEEGSPACAVRVPALGRRSKLPKQLRGLVRTAAPSELPELEDRIEE